MVPGLPQDPAKPSPGTLWYRRSVRLPLGNWQQAELTLKGARFAPEVYVNGLKVSSSAGGMAPTIHLLRSADVVPGATVVLEIALKSLNSLDPTDASMVPQADLFRTNVSSGLWDSVTLHFSGAARITAMTPFSNWVQHNVAIHWSTTRVSDDASRPVKSRHVRALLLDERRKVIAQSADQDAGQNAGTANLDLSGAVKSWSPEHPIVYKLRLEETEDDKLIDAREISWGWKEFRTQDKRFYLNGEPIELRGGVVMWHRFLRNPEAKTVAFDPQWFRANVVMRLKSHGANFLRFNLGLPPESFLDLCDREGLMVQMEWPFLHGIKASPESLREQWRAWLDVAMRHPSIVIIHPWNETEGDDLKVGWKSINEVLADYPPLVVAHRDTVHLHKFWWSFENLGLYYDSADQFDHAVMADEFGGNYLDQEGNPGAYPNDKETFLRYLGRNQTRDLRLQLNAESNARVAEYWRRIGVAGFSPFCILGSPFDGSSWFLGPLAKPQPMPVWDALTAAWSSQSVSLDVWDRNYLPGQRVELPLFFLNDTNKTARLNATVRIMSLHDPHQLISLKTAVQQVPPHAHVRTTVNLVLPLKKGEWRFEAELKNPVPGVSHPILSSWNFRTLSPVAPPQIGGIAVGVPEHETELHTFLLQNGMRPVHVEDRSARLILTSSKSWELMTRTPELRRLLGEAVNRGTSVVLLDIGPRDLGQGYRKGDLGPLESAPKLSPGAASPIENELFSGIKIKFTPLPEPESHVQPGPGDASLWNGLPVAATWLWNGLRGGLIAPAANMQVSGLGNDAQAGDVIPLSACGRGLTRTDIVEMMLGTGKGNVILSQVLTAGRLVRGTSEAGQYGIRYDPAAEQFVLNMLAKAIREK